MAETISSGRRGSSCARGYRWRLQLGSGLAPRAPKAAAVKPSSAIYSEPILSAPSGSRQTSLHQKKIVAARTNRCLLPAQAILPSSPNCTTWPGKSGIQVEDFCLAHKQTEIPNRGMTRVSIDDTSLANYKERHRLLGNGLQSSAKSSPWTL